MGPRAFICSVVLLSVLNTANLQNTPPKILKPEKKITENILPGTTHSLSCMAEANPNPKYRWTFNNDAVPADVTVNENTGDLSIAKFGDEDEGNYQCIAENDISPGIVAVAMSPVISLKKVRLGAEWPDSTQVDVTRTVGDYLKLTCDNAPESVPKAQYSWYLAEGEASEGEVKTTDRIYIDAEGSLHFVYVKQEDQNNNLRYKCSLYNSELDIIKLGSEKNLAVTTVSGAIPQTKARSQFQTNPAQFLRTKEAELECVFSGFPIPTITWFDKQKNQITSNSKYDIVSTENGRKLIIKDLREEDEGMYTCEGSNAGGSDEVAIFLDVTSGPIWVESLSSQTVPEGKEAVFTCRARPVTGDSDLNAPIWFRNGVDMTVTNDAKYEFSDNSRVLTVKNLNKDTDIMCFQCNVSNAIGYEFGDGCLNVIEPIVVTVQPNLEQHISKGDQVNLTVIGKTDPAFTLTYRWHFRNVTYDSPNKPPFVFVNETTMQAYINTSDLSEEDYKNINGTYIRELYHLYDKLNVSIEVILDELPVVGTVAAAAVDLWWIALIVALVILIIVIVLIVFICNRKRQEGTYPLDKKERANDIDPEKDLADSGFHDLSRAPGDEDFPSKKSSGINPNFDYGDDMDMDNDDDESLMEYGGGDFNTDKFNEDGSFIGQYTSKNKTPEVKQSPMPLNHHATESQI